MTEPKIEHCIKLSGKAWIPEAVEIAHNYEVKCSGGITSKTESDNDDGSRTIYYKFEPVMIEILTNKGQRLHAADTRSRSVQLRSSLYRNWREANIEQPFEDWYDKQMVDIIKAVIEVRI